MYLRISCYCDACLNSSDLRVGVTTLLNTIQYKCCCIFCAFLNRNCNWHRLTYGAFPDFGDIVNSLCPLARLTTTMTERPGPFLPVTTERISLFLLPANAPYIRWSLTPRLVTFFAPHVNRPNSADRNSEFSDKLKDRGLSRGTHIIWYVSFAIGFK